MKGSIYVELEKCLGCHSCELACALAHSKAKELVKAILEDPPPVSRVCVEQVQGAAVPLQCRHCEDAPCVAVCPKKAIEKLGPGQAVVIDEEKCTGCKFCVAACPFGVVVVSEVSKVAVKCDLCLDRLGQGQEPACVCACPSAVLFFGTADELSKRKATAKQEQQEARAEEKKS